MFGIGKTNSVKIDKDLYNRIKKVADIAGYATVEEFIQHILEKEMLHFEDTSNDGDIRAKLKGLGYIS
jgi:metal-responsive CopG/Arc/MetJ family transcriptional regulator